MRGLKFTGIPEPPATKGLPYPAAQCRGAASGDLARTAELAKEAAKSDDAGKLQAALASVAEIVGHAAKAVPIAALVDKLQADVHPAAKADQDAAVTKGRFAAMRGCVAGTCQRLKGTATATSKKSLAILVLLILIAMWPLYA